jgi:hypothetical protein
MEKQTKADQEIINRIANQKHFLKEIDVIMEN